MPAPPPPPLPSSRSPLFAVAVTVLVCFALLALALEGSAISSVNTHLRAWGGDTDVAAAAAIATAASVQHNASIMRDSSADWIMQTAPNATVPSADLLHLSLLQAACLKHKDSGIPWLFANPGVDQENKRMNEALLFNKDDPDIVERLQECPDVDVYLPEGLRGHGYCEDAVAYAKYLNSRLLPRWVFDTPLVDAKLKRTVMYHDLCPHTPVLLFNHYWDDIPDSPYFPPTKPVYLMPNIEMYELDEKFYWRADVVLCKTRACQDRLTQWYAQEGNPRNTQVFYTRHTTSDVAHFARHSLGAAASSGAAAPIKPKDFANVTFIHTVGTSAQKGTRQVVDCWLSRPDYPPLDLYINNDTYQWLLGEPHDMIARINAAANIRVTNHRMEPLEFGRAIAEASFFLCTSVMEGYGHYINQARASGGVIVTSNRPPMSELIVAPGMGVLVNATAHQDPNMFLGGASTKEHALRGVEGMTAAFDGPAVCRAVDEVLVNTTVSQREAMARHAQQQYHLDTAFFAREMLRLRLFAKQQAQETRQKQEQAQRGTSALRRERGA